MVTSANDEKASSHITPLYFSSQEITNLGPFEKWRATFTMTNYLIGENGAGKTSFHHAIELLAGVTHKRLLRDGCNEGTSKVVLSSKYSATAKLKRSDQPPHDIKYSLDVSNPEGGEVRRPATVMEGLIACEFFDPIRFLEKDNWGRVDYLTKYADVRFTGAQINQVYKTPLGKLSIDNGQLEPVTLRPPGESISLARLDELYQEIESSRTGVNREIRDLEGGVRNAQRLLDTIDDSINWSKERDRLQQEIASLNTEIATAKSDIALAARNKRDDQERQHNQAIKPHAEAIESYRKLAESLHSAVEMAASYNRVNDTERLVEQLWDGCHGFVQALRAIPLADRLNSEELAAITKWENNETANSTQSRSERRIKLEAQLAEARIKADLQLKQTGVRENIAQQEKEIKGKALRSEQFTVILDAFDRLRTSALSVLGIEGFDIKFEKTGNTTAPVIYVDGQRLDTHNEQQQIFYAVQFICKVRRLATKSDEQILVILADAPRLTEHFLQILEDACKASEIQLIVTVYIPNAKLRLVHSIKEVMVAHKEYIDAQLSAGGSEENQRELAGRNA